MRLGIAEILDKASKAPKKQDKIKVLQDNDSYALREVLRCAFDPTITFLLPKGPFKYSPNPLEAEQETILLSEARRLYLFVEGGHPTLTQEKRLVLFKQLLENLHSADAELLVSVKDKIMPYKTVTENLVRTAFPNLLHKKEVAQTFIDE